MSLSDAQQKALSERFPLDWQSRIESLSEAMALKGYGYKNHFAVLQKWEMPGIKTRGVRKGTDLMVYNTEAYDFDALEQVLAQKMNKASLVFSDEPETSPSQNLMKER